MTLENLTFRINTTLNRFGLNKWSWSEIIDRGNYNINNIDVIYENEEIKNKSKKSEITPKEEGVKKKTAKPKKDRKINISQDDMDKLCEVYDWYIQVKDNKALQVKKTSNKKDILLENGNVKDIKSVNIRVEKETWEEFERLCSNSSFNKKEIITQALKDFMKTYKNLL